MDFLVYGMEILPAKPNVSLIELALSSKGTAVLALLV